MGCTGGNQISEQEFQKKVEEIKTYQSETTIKHNFGIKNLNLIQK